MRIGTLIEGRPMERKSHVDYARNVWAFTITWQFLSLSLNASHVSYHKASPLFVSHCNLFRCVHNPTVSFRSVW